MLALYFFLQIPGEVIRTEFACHIRRHPDACLAQDKFSRVACETFVKSNLVVVGGEITTKAQFDYNAIIRQAIREIGYVNNDDVFHADHVFVNNYVTAQSPDIAQGVDAKSAKGKKTAEQGAGIRG
jgi:S-adenosylmethionine synthetase